MGYHKWAGRRERLHALFLRKHSSYTTVNKKLSPPIKSDVHSVQSLTVKGTTWYRTYYRSYVKFVTWEPRSSAKWRRVDGSRLLKVLEVTPFSGAEGSKKNFPSDIFIPANQITICWFWITRFVLLTASSGQRRSWQFSSKWKKFPEFYGRRLSTVFTTAHPWRWKR